jgi:hypothetical protein
MREARPCVRALFPHARERTISIHRPGQPLPRATHPRARYGTAWSAQFTVYFMFSIYFFFSPFLLFFIFLFLSYFVFLFSSFC